MTSANGNSSLRTENSVFLAPESLFYLLCVIFSLLHFFGRRPKWSNGKYAYGCRCDVLCFLEPRDGVRLSKLAVSTHGRQLQCQSITRQSRRRTRRQTRRRTQRLAGTKIEREIRRHTHTHVHTHEDLRVCFLCRRKTQSRHVAWVEEGRVTGVRTP